MTENDNFNGISFWGDDKTPLHKEASMTENSNFEESSFWGDNKTPPPPPSSSPSPSPSRKEGKKKEKQGGVMVFIKDVISIILMAALISVVLKTFIVDTRSIPTESMYPTIYISDRVILSKLSYIGDKTPKRGDIIVLMPPAELGMNSDLLKRVIGLPGEIVEVKDNYVYIDGKPLSEDYLAAQPAYFMEPVIVPEGCYFLLGDNRNNSLDSHLWRNQFVPMSDIKGKAVYRYWPIDRFGNIYHADKVGSWVRWMRVHWQISAILLTIMIILMVVAYRIIHVVYGRASNNE